MDGEDQRRTRGLVEIEIQQQVTQLSRIFTHVRPGVRSAVRGWIDALAAQEEILYELDIGILAQGLVVDEAFSGVGTDHQARYAQTITVLVHLGRHDIIIKPPQSSQDRSMTVLSHSGPCMTALIRLVVHACPSLTRAVGCSLFGPLGVIQLMAGSVPVFASL